MKQEIFTFNGVEYYSVNAVRTAISKQTKVCFGVPQTAKEWKKLGVTYTIKEIPDPVPTEPTEEETEPITMYEFDEISLSLDEASNVKNHILPYGEVWTDGLRSYERRAMYDEADRFKTRALEMGDAELEATIVQYKSAIRDTQYKEGYPQNVEYPPIPWE